jgi:pimeloyl-[acyl-carrier protein] methyl ester esterase
MTETITNWFLIRGLIRGAPHWLDFPDALARAQPNSRIFFLDIPGNGFRNAEPSPVSVPAMADHMRAEFHDILSRHPDPHQRNLLVAFSLGGMVTLNWLQRDPKRVHGAALVNTSVRGLSPLHHRIRPQAYPQMLRALTMPDGPDRERRVVDLISNAPPADRARTADHWSAIQRKHPVSRANALRQMLAAARFRPRLHDPGVPILLIRGLGDRLVNPLCSDALHRRWGWPMISHPDAGHDLSSDDTPWLVQTLLDWTPPLATAPIRPQ